ncbi:MAG: radical SAM protein [Archangium sp.]|nr:radical SAM protein [Archangium sp.]
MFEELLTAARFSKVHTWGRFLWGEAGAARSLYEHDGDVAHFDLEGRWQRAKVNGRTLLRGLDGVVLERFGGAAGEDVRLTDVRLAHEAVTSLLERARLDAPVLLPGWTVEQLLAEKERFLEAYRPVGIVPPDRYRSLIIQATQGCAYNGCLFCSLYKGQRYRVVPPAELRTHLQKVKAFVGSGLEGRRGVFLGEANALAMPQAALLEVFDLLHAELPRLATDVSSFIDAFDDYRTAEELAALRARGLTRVFIGVESGDEPTLAVLGKPATVAGVSRLVQSLKAGGVSVGVIFLAGLGRAHVEKSAELLPTLGLDEHDVVYVSPLVVSEGPLAVQLERRGLVNVDAEAEAAELRARLGGRAKVARYDVRRWVYA